MRSRLIVLFLTLLCLGCDVFVNWVGGKGDPCGFYNDCNEGLTCNYGVCVEPLSEGEDCNIAYSGSDNNVPVCGEGLLCENNLCVPAGALNQSCLQYLTTDDPNPYCDFGLACSADNICLPAGGEGELCIPRDDVSTVEEQCTAAETRCVEGICHLPFPETVNQPNSSNVWLRCPVGMTWDRFECIGEPAKYLYDDALLACPDGFGLPAEENFQSLLAGCEKGYITNKDVCELCVDSPDCIATFGADDENDDNEEYRVYNDGGEYWFLNESEYESGDWIVNLGDSGWSTFRRVDDNDTYGVLCLQN
jgi:hypothetical protein